MSFFDDVNDQKRNLLKTMIIDHSHFFHENMDDHSKHMQINDPNLRR